MRDEVGISRILELAMKYQMPAWFVRWEWYGLHKKPAKRPGPTTTRATTPSGGRVGMVKSLCCPETPAARVAQQVNLNHSRAFPALI